jgi:hypothetical protein
MLNLRSTPTICYEFSVQKRPTTEHPESPQASLAFSLTKALVSRQKFPALMVPGGSGEARFILTGSRNHFLGKECFFQRCRAAIGMVEERGRILRNWETRKLMAAVLLQCSSCNMGMSLRINTIFPFRQIPRVPPPRLHQLQSLLQLQDQCSSRQDDRSRQKCLRRSLYPRAKCRQASF